MNFLILFIISIFTTFAAWAQVAGEVDISADSLEIEQAKGTAMFAGNVEVNHKDMTLKAEKLRVFYAKSGKTDETKKENEGVERIVAENNVVLRNTAQDITVSGTKAVYDVDPQTIVVTGNDGVLMVRGGATLKGNKLVYDMATGKADLQGAGQRVKARFSLKGVQ